MFDYLAFIHAGIPKASNDARADGVRLAKECLKNLNAVGNKDRFPPSLLILLASPAYLQKQKAKQLLNGINDTFRETVGEVDLIGSSVGGVFFNQRVYPKGALLVCLASTLIEARVAVGTDARLNPQNAIDELLRNLELDPSKRIDLNPLANRLIITFMPGCNRTASDGAIFPAPELHRLLYKGVQERIWMIGGVSSANSWSLKKDGFQFAGRQVFRDSVVAANILTGVPIGVSLNDGLASTNKILKVTKLASDKRTILEFDKKSRQLNLNHGGFMLAKLSADDERTVDIPLPLSDGSVQMLRPLRRNDYFQVFRQTSRVSQKALSGIDQAKRRVFVERPVAALLFPCNAYNPRSKRGTALVENALTDIEKSLNKRSKQLKPCVGGFFDGEIGVDAQGRSRLTNGGVGYLVFGDEIRERTPLYMGVSALARYGHKLLAETELPWEQQAGNNKEGFTGTSPFYETIRNAVEIIRETGFPGAMLSLMVSSFDRGRGKKEKFVLGRAATGARFTKIKELTRRRYDGKDILAFVARDRKARFIPDSKTDRFCDQESIKLSGIISQYILPLKRLDDTVFGTLQVDLGDLHDLSPEDFVKTEKARMLDCFAEVFSASINRIANAVENEIKMELDKALGVCMSVNDFHEGIERFFLAAGKAFGVEMGHLRLLESGHAKGRPGKRMLSLETGFGACYEAEKNKRRELNPSDFSPICCAFRSKTPHIVNDVESDPAFQAMLKSISHDPQLFTSLKKTRSYAAIAFTNEQGKQLGALSFGSTERWFFLKLHRAALHALAERAGFLVQHLRTKVERNFLQGVSPKLAERNLEHARPILREVTEVFRDQLKADIASLYLWDDDRKKYVLRAQSNWKDKRWEDAASYDETSGWIGVRAINRKPLYVKDLHKYYRDEKYDAPQGRYAHAMFGRKLSENFTVEAIGLPLRIGPKDRDKFGVLTLYRRVKRDQRAGFAITQMPVLQEGANSVAGLVNAVLRHRDVMWKQQEEHRRQEFYHAINSIEDMRTFDRRICQQIISSFHAIQADFYQTSKSGKELRLLWIAGARRNPKTRIMESTKRQTPDSFVQAAMSTAAVTVQRRKLAPTQQRDVNALKTENMVERACIPLIGAGRLLGVLDARWNINAARSFSLELRHDSEHLRVLGQIAGSVYRRNQIIKEREQSNLALQVTAAYAVQRAHRLRNTIQRARNRSRDVSKGLAGIDSVIPHIKVAMNIARETTVLGKRVLYPSFYTCRLSWLIHEAFDKDGGALKKKFRRLGIKLPKPLRYDSIVNVDPAHTEDALYNLVDNAANAIERRQQRRKMSEEPRITITATPVDEETTRVVISDNGLGMTDEEIRAALRGFVRAGDHEGVGVLISYALLTAQGGSLAFESVKFKGTDTIVILPSAEME